MKDQQWHFEFTVKASDQFRALPIQLQNRIKKKLFFWQSHPNPFIFASAIENFGIATHRFRVGDYRIICCTEKKTVILVLKVGHRRDVYRSKI